MDSMGWNLTPQRSCWRGQPNLSAQLQTRAIRTTQDGCSIGLASYAGLRKRRLAPSLTRRVRVDSSPLALRPPLDRVKKARRWLVPLLGLLVIALMLYRFEHSQIYHPTRDAEYTPDDVGRPAEEVWLKTPDGLRLHAWFFAADKLSSRARFAVLYCHGNGGNITSRPGYYRAILETGVSLLTFDYRGYGRSDGEPGESGTYTDAQAAYQWLRSRGFAPEHILVWGESLGGGIASHVATTERIGGLVLQSTFTNIPDIGAELFPWLPVKLLSRIKYDTHSRLPAITCPVVVMHSRADTTIRFSHGEKNFAAAREPKAFIELEGDHNDPLLANRSRFVAGAEKLLQFAEDRESRVEGKPSPDAGSRPSTLDSRP